MPKKPRQRHGRGGQSGAGGSLPATYTLTVTVVGSGSISDSTGLIDTAAGRTSASFVAGTAVLLTASPGGGASFDAWSGDGSGTGQIRTVTMSAAKAVTATFVAAIGGSAIDGTGAVIVEDIPDTQAPTSPGPWSNVNSVFVNQGLWTPSDGQITYHTDTPDPHTLIGGITAAAYRRLRVSEVYVDGNQALPTSTLTIESIATRLDVPSSGRCSINGTKAFDYTGKTNTTLTGCTNVSGFTGTATDGDRVAIQSLYDASVPNSSCRTQLYEPDAHHFTAGDHNHIYFSVRCQDPTPILLDTQAGSTQLCQFKIFGPSAGPVLAIREGRTKFLLRQQVYPGPAATTIATWDKLAGHEGDWVRYALDINFARQAAGGYIQVHADLDGGGDLVPITDELNVDTMYADDPDQHARFSCGPYQNLSVPAVYRDYSGLQICEAS